MHRSSLNLHKMLSISLQVMTKAIVRNLFQGRGVEVEERRVFSPVSSFLAMSPLYPCLKAASHIQLTDRC